MLSQQTAERKQERIALRELANALMKERRAKKRPPLRCAGCDHPLRGKRLVADAAAADLSSVGRVRLFLCAPCYWKRCAYGHRFGTSNTLRRRVRMEPSAYTSRAARIAEP